MPMKSPEGDGSTRNPLKLDVGFEEALQRFMKAPPMPQEAKRPQRPTEDKKRRGK